jgi:hypothetical protein
VIFAFGVASNFALDGNTDNTFALPVMAMDGEGSPVSLLVLDLDGRCYAHGRMQRIRTRASEFYLLDRLPRRLSPLTIWSPIQSKAVESGWEFSLHTQRLENITLGALF